MFRTETLWIAAFLATGLVGGLLYNWPDSTPPEQPVEANETSVEPPPTVDELVESAPLADEMDSVRENPQPETSDVPQAFEQSDIWSDVAPQSSRRQPIDPTVLEIGDRQLLAGNGAGAYKHYSKLWKQADLPLDPVVLIRLALAAEVAGFHAQAEDHYRSAIRVAEKRSPQQLLCFLGTARVWEQQGRLSDAISLLSELYLLYSGESQLDLVRKSILEQLGNCLQKRLLKSEVVAEALAKEPMEYHWVPVRLYPILEAVDANIAQSPDASQSTGIQLLQDYNGDAALILFEIHRHGYPVLNFLNDAQRLAQVEFVLTERAKSTVVGRLTNIEVVAMPLAFLLDHALESLDLTWSQNENTINIIHRDELTPRDEASFDLAKTQRMLRQIEMVFSKEAGEDPVRVAAIMNDANNLRLSGGRDEAAAKYRAARESEPMNELSAKLYFNDASLALHNGDKLNALNACYMTLDQTLMSNLQGQVYTMIAELELELGQPEKAITAGSRGLRRAEDPAVLTRAAMTLTRAYLVSGDPDSANAVVFENAQQMVGERERRLASALATYARFLRVNPQHGLQDEGQRLVMALATLKPDDVDNFIDSLIVSNAYTKIGIRTKAIENLKNSLEQAPSGFWSERIRLDLVKALYESSELEAANEAVEAFETVSKDRLPEALLLHASIQLGLGNLETSETICRRLMSVATDPAVKSQALNVLGQSLRHQGKHYAAALCFAGVLPEPEEVDESQNAFQGVAQ